MTERPRRGHRDMAAARMLWVAAYTLAMLAPFALMVVAPRLAGRSFGVEFGAALGFAAFNVLALQLVLPARARLFTRPFGADLLLRYHRQLGTAAVVLVVAHVVAVMADDPSRLRLLVWSQAPTRARAAAAATVALGLLAVTSARRRQLRLSYEAWRGIHLALGVAMLALSLVHMAKVGKYAAVPSIWIACLVAGGAALTAAAHLRLQRPRRAGRHPYRVAGLSTVAPGITAVELEAEGRPGAAFEPGQFAWVKLADRPYSLDEHPFSYTSSALRPDRPAFAIKAAGDFTADVPELRPGTRLLLDGPHGSFRPAHPSAGYLLVAAGVGITPMLSVLRTLDDLGDRRPLTLVYGNRRVEDIAFRAELDDLARRLRLRLVHVLSQPPQDWTGERGRIDAAVLARIAAALPAPVNVLVCGPPGLADLCEQVLPGLGTPLSSIHAERFESV